jgi:hypothetical protein
VVLSLWLPVLAIISAILGFGIARSVARLVVAGVGTWTFQISMAWRLMVLAGLIGLIVVLLRLALRQLHAVRDRLYYRLPYSVSVARIAIELRKKELLRSLHLGASNAVFLTEDHPIVSRWQSKVH